MGLSLEDSNKRRAEIRREFHRSDVGQWLVAYLMELREEAVGRVTSPKSTDQLPYLSGGLATIELITNFLVTPPPEKEQSDGSERQS